MDRQPPEELPEGGRQGDLGLGLQGSVPSDTRTSHWRPQLVIATSVAPFGVPLGVGDYNAISPWMSGVEKSGSWSVVMKGKRAGHET